MKIAVQGDVGSACETAGYQFADRLRESAAEFVHCITAVGTVAAIVNGEADFGVFAVESPLGTPVEETRAALADYRDVLKIRDALEMPVEHVILAKNALPFERYRTVVSHEIPLAKHSTQLRQLFPYADFLETLDTGLAARMLSVGELTPDTVVVALPSAAKAFDLTIIVDRLVGNDGYQTRFELLSI